jgi:hypothetical protein
LGTGGTEQNGLRGEQSDFSNAKEKDQALIPFEKLMQKIHRDRKKMEWYWWADPGSATCFAILFAAINPYTKDVYWLDNIYEKNQGEMTTKKIGRRAIAIRNEIYDDPLVWRGGYDEAATWFSNEWNEHFPNEPALEPSQKALNDKSDGLSLMKDIMLAGKWHMSDRCEEFHKELRSYKTDDKGRLIKRNDHLIDDGRYILGAAGYSLTDKEEYIEARDENFRGAKISDDFDELDDWGNKSDVIDPW